MKFLIFRYFCLFFVFGEYEQLPSYLTSCFGDNDSSDDRELISSPPDLPWKTNDNRQLIDQHPHEFQLGSETIPRDYHLTITPDFQRGRFDGGIVIEIEAVKKTKTIKLNSEKLDIKEVTVCACTAPARNLDRTTFKLDVKKNFLIIKTSENLLANKRYTVSIKFSGHVYQNNPLGFAMYGTKFATSSKDAYVAETLFDPFFARKAFPCYDELHYRTPFSIVAVLNENETAISSARLTRTELVQEENKQEKRKMVFTDVSSKPIPLNMVYYAFLDQEYAYESARGKYFVWTVKDLIDQVSYAVQDLENVVKIMESQIFSILYSQRIDLIVPIQKQMRPGFLSSIRKNLLCDAEYCAEKYQEQVTKSIFHHVSNRWFGQYVSIRSWNYFWLRDGFGAYYGFRFTYTMKSDWRMSQFHGSVVMQSILFDDRRFFLYPLTRSHNLSKREIFETQYSKSHFEFYSGKASLIIRMLENIVGQSTFDRAIKLFLIDKHANGGLVTPDDLWNAFIQQIEVDGIDLKLPNSQTLRDVMKPYTTQVGYPLVTVSETIDRKLVIEQAPYVSTKKNSLAALLESRYGLDENQSWTIPITITTQTKANFDTRPIAWSMPNSKITLDMTLNESEWYILNVLNTGYYRVNYRHDNWMKLVEQLKKGQSRIHPLNRAQLIVDSHVLAVDMKLGVEVPIEMTKYLSDERDPIVWMVALNQFKRFYMALTEKSRPAYKKFFVGYLKNEYLKTGFKINRGDSHPSKIWKSELLKFLCWIGDHECITEAEKMYNDCGKLTDIEPNLQYVVFCTMLQRRDSASVMANLEEMVKKTNKTCLRDLVREVSICRYAPVGDENLIRMQFESLLDRAMVGDTTVENIVNDILSNFDTLLPLLKVIRNQIYRMSVTGINIKEKLDGLTKFVEVLKGKQFGLAEFIAFLDLYSTARKLEKALEHEHKSLRIALLKIIASFRGGIEDLRVHESLLSSLLKRTEGDSKMSKGTSSSSTSSEPVSVSSSPASNTTMDIDAMIRDILIESESLVNISRILNVHQKFLIDADIESNSKYI